jgi:hypothetical protein
LVLFLNIRLKKNLKGIFGKKCFKKTRTMMLLDGEVQIEALWSSAPFFQQKNEPQSACERKREKYERFLKKRFTFGHLFGGVFGE